MTTALIRAAPATIAVLMIAAVVLRVMIQVPPGMGVGIFNKLVTRRNRYQNADAQRG